MIQDNPFKLVVLLIWGWGLLGVDICFANRTSDGFESHFLHLKYPYSIMDSAYGFYPYSLSSILSKGTMS